MLSRELARGSSRIIEAYVKTSQRLGKSGYELRRRGEDLCHTGRSRATGDSRADKIDDTAIEKLSYDIAKKIQDTMTYPGQVKITVIRETRSVSYAK